MAKKNLLVHLDMNKQELQNAKAHNLTTAQIATLAGSLVAADKGLFVYDTDLLKLFIWDGTAFIDQMPPAPQIGQYRGGVLHTGAEPSNLVSGDYVVFTSAGVVTNFGGTQTVQIGDWAIYNGTTWDILQGNVDVATQSTVGLVQLATAAEAAAGTDASKVITPATLSSSLQAKQLEATLNLVANVTQFIDVFITGIVKHVTFLRLDANGNFEPVELAWVHNANFFRLEVTSNVNVQVFAKISV